MRTLVLGVIGSFAAASLAPATVITQWNFNGDSATTVPGGAASPTPSIGSGTASLLAPVTSSFASGIANGGSTDPVTTSPPNFGWQTTTYTAQGVDSGTAGVRFNVSTAGVTGPGLFVYLDTRHSNTSSRFVRIDYSTDGTTFTPGDVFEATLGGDTWYRQRQVDLSAVPGVFDNPNFAFRVVTVFDPALGNAYSASNPGSSYASGGTLRHDMVTVATVAIPEPASMGLAALAGATLLRRRRA